MRAFVLAVAMTLFACRPSASAVTAEPQAFTTPPPAPPAATPSSAVREKAPAPDAPASVCFAEPVAYDKTITPKPISDDIDARLRQCEAAREGEAAACRFAVAKEYFEAKRFERAGRLFLAIAHDPKAVDSVAAVQLALESINFLGSSAEPPRPSCYDLMAEEVSTLLPMHCAPAPRPGADDACAMLHRIAVDIARPGCRLMPADTRDPDTQYVEAGQAYLKLAQGHCIFGKGRQKLNEDLRCGEMLYNAHSAFSAGHDPDHAARARALLLDPKNGLEQTESAKRVAKP